MRIRKSVLILSLIASFLMSMAVVPSYAQMATIYVEPAEIVGTDPFVVFVYVNDVEHMFGYQFKLTYDTDVLTCVDFVSFAPFTLAQGIPPGGYIDDAEGFVEIYYSYPMAEEEGLTTSTPAQIAGFAFTVDAPGASPLQIEDSKIPNVYGEPITHVAMCGEFRTTAGLPMAKFSYLPEDPVEGGEVTFTSESTDPGTSIVAWDWDFGDGTTGTGEVVTHTYTEPGGYTVTLTVTDDEMNTDSQSKTIAVSALPPPGADLLSAYAWPRRWYFDFFKYWTNTTYLRATVINLDTEEPVLVRVLFYVYDENTVNLGTLEVNGTVPPRTTHRYWWWWWPWWHSGIKSFMVPFDVTDPQWEFAYEEANATNRVTKEWTIRAECWYNDFDLPTGEHHWTQIEEPTEIYFTLTAIAGGWKHHHH